MREPDRSRLFLAFRPPRSVAAEIAFWRESFLFGGNPVDNERLRLTLFMLGDFDRAPPDLIARVKDALSDSFIPSCRIVLDTLAGGAGSALLASSQNLSGARRVQSLVAGLLARAGIAPAPGWRFSPHVTLLHDHGYCGHWPIDPIRWTAEEIVLIESLVGRGRHIAHAVLPLGGSAEVSPPEPVAAPSRSAPALAR